MPSVSRERLKLYIVIGLGVLFVLMGYFRFIHGKAAPAGRQAGEAGPPARIEASAVDVKGLPPPGQAPNRVFEPPRTALRNIFSPGEEPPSRTAPVTAPAEPPPKPLPSLKLTGTIIGGEKPLAVINGRFLKMGEQIEGLRVVSIERDHVWLAAEGQRVRLNVLDAPGGQAP